MKVIKITKSNCNLVVNCNHFFSQNLSHNLSVYIEQRTIFNWFINVCTYYSVCVEHLM